MMLYLYISTSFYMYLYEAVGPKQSLGSFCISALRLIYEYYVELPTYKTSQIDMTVCRSVGLAIPQTRTQTPIHTRARESIKPLSNLVLCNILPHLLWILCLFVCCVLQSVFGRTLRCTLRRAQGFRPLKLFRIKWCQYKRCIISCLYLDLRKWEEVAMNPLFRFALSNLNTHTPHTYADHNETPLAVFTKKKKKEKLYQIYLLPAHSFLCSNLL